MGEDAGTFRKTHALNGAYTVDAGLAVLARQLIIRKAVDDAAQILLMLNIQEES